MEQDSTKMLINQIMQFKATFNEPLIKIFNVEYVVGFLDRSKIESIDKIYRSKEDGFNLLEFIRFFLNVIQHQQIETLYLTISLIDFFKQVSKSCGYKERLMFVDITNYICNRILDKRNEQNQIESNFIPDYRTIRPNYKIKDYLINPPKIYSNKDEVVYKLSLNKIQIDKNKHESVVTNCYFSKTLHKIFTLDILSDSIAVYNTSCNLLKKIKPSFSKLKKDIVVLSFAYSERQERIGAVLKDFSINFWDNSDNFEFEKSISAASFCQEYQTNIWFFEYFNNWVTSDKSGYLYIWDLQRQCPERKIKMISQTKVNDLCVIPCINLIAVVQQRKVDPLNLDKKQNQQQVAPVIMVYDYFKGEVVTKIELKIQNRIPHTLQYSEAYHVLLSAGYQKKISVYQINKQFLDTNQKGQLTGHQSLITSFTILKKSPMVVSADDKGKVKIWDLRNYKCVQTLDFRDKTNITKLLDMIQLGKIGVLGSRINFVEFDEKIKIQKKMMNQRDKVSPYWVEFDYHSFEIIMLTKKDLRIFDMRKGTLKNVFCEFHTEDTEITYFKYLQSREKFIVGNEKGQIRLYSVRTGRLQGKLINHTGSIVYAQYDQLNKIFITMGQDSTIQIQKQIMMQQQKFQSKNIEVEADNKSLKNQRTEKYEKTQKKQNHNSLLLRQIKNNFNGKQITLGAVSIYHGFIAVGSSEKSIYIWDYEFSKLLIEINLPEDIPSTIQPTALAFINGYSVLLIGTSQGTLYCLKIMRKDQNFMVQNLCTFQSEQKQPITHINVDILLKGFTITKQKLMNCKIHIAFTSGFIKLIDFKNVTDKIEQQPSATHKQSFNAQRQLRQNFQTQIQKNKFYEYTIRSTESLFTEKQFPCLTFQAHKTSLTGIQVVELDERFLGTIGSDQRFKIWRDNYLVCDLNINLPLPYKWEIQISDEQKQKQKIMFALKIIQKIFLNYGNDISIKQSKSLKIRKLFEELQQDPKHLTEPTFQLELQKDEQIVLFQNQFSKADMHYDSVKKFNFNQVAGPTLRQIQVRKKLDDIQKQWQSNKDKTEEDKAKLLISIRQKAHKNQEKQNIIQFLETRNFGIDKAKDPYQKHPFVTNIINKINVADFSVKKQSRLDTMSKSVSMNFLGKQKTLLGCGNLLKQRGNKLKKNFGESSHLTFESYYQQKIEKSSRNKESNYRISRLQTANVRKEGSKFRDILLEMKQRMQKCKRPVLKKNGQSKNLRSYIIATSEGRRKI